MKIVNTDIPSFCSKGTPHNSSDHEEQLTRTPPKINKLTKKDKRQQELERRRAAVAKFVAKEMEDIEFCKFFYHYFSMQTFVCNIKINSFDIFCLKSTNLQF